MEALNEAEFNKLTDYFVNNDIKENGFSRMDPDQVLSSILETLWILNYTFFIVYKYGKKLFYKK